MAFANAVLIVPSFFPINSQNDDHNLSLVGFHGETSSGSGSSVFCVGSCAKRTDIVNGKRRLNAIDTRIVENAQIFHIIYFSKYIQFWNNYYKFILFIELYKFILIKSDNNIKYF